MDVAALLLFVFLYFPAQYFAVLVHEMGHYSVFRWKDITPQWVDIGRGALLFKFQRKGTWFHIRKLPFSGEVVVSPGHVKKMGVFAAILMLLAGPVFHLGFAVSIAIFSKYYVVDVLQDALWLLSCVFAIEAVQQLRPFRKFTEKNGKKEETRSDGFQIRNFWKRREQFKIANDSW